MKPYKYWLDRFVKHDLVDFTLTSEGLLWLKLRSIERRELLSSFVEDAKIDIDLSNKNRMEEMWAALCEDGKFKLALMTFMRKCQHLENKHINETFENIRSNLYRMSEFHWGGGFRNSLDKAIEMSNEPIR